MTGNLWMKARVLSNKRVVRETFDDIDYTADGDVIFKMINGFI